MEAPRPRANVPSCDMDGGHCACRWSYASTEDGSQLGHRHCNVCELILYVILRCAPLTDLTSDALDVCTLTARCNLHEIKCMGSSQSLTSAKCVSVHTRRYHFLSFHLLALFLQPVPQGSVSGCIAKSSVTGPSEDKLPTVAASQLVRRHRRSRDRTLRECV